MQNACSSGAYVYDILGEWLCEKFEVCKLAVSVDYSCRHGSIDNEGTTPTLTAPQH